MSQRKKTIFGLVFLLLLTAFSVGFAQEAQAPGRQDAKSLDQPLPLDPKVVFGRLDNGLSYYIRKNRKPETRAFLRLVVNAGSVLEDDDQLGLAHFVEHMAFNGTRHFAKQDLVKFMESIGMRFGPELNAYTGFDETIYILEVPTDSAEVLETAFQILEDWAHELSFEPEEIDKERGVIVEEWRLGRGASARMMDKQFPVLFQGSRYARRLPIGDRETILNFSYDTLKRFYRDWYRPDLMAVIAVGDFDEPVVEKLIKEHFSRLVTPQNERPRPLYAVPDHEKTLFAIARDKEATGTSVAVYHKLPAQDRSTAAALRQMVLEMLYNGMLNQRFYEITRKPDPPFLRAYSSLDRLSRSKAAYTLGASVKEGGIERGLEALFRESERVTRFGFTPTELDREKRDFERFLEQAYAERDKTESGSYVAEYTRHFLEGEAAPGIEYEVGLYKQFLPGISLEEINRLGRSWISPSSRVVLVSAPDKEGVVVPSEQTLLEIIDRTAGEKITPYEDKAADQPLLESLPEPGQVVHTETLPEMEITEWTLANGVRIVLKPTDFKEDEILVRGFSPGGTSLAEDKDYVAASTAAMAVAAGGLGKFNAVDLGKALTGKAAMVRPYISSLEEGITGSASPKDLETLFQLIYLTFTAPRADASVFDIMVAQMKAVLANRAASPEVAFADTMTTTLAQNHYRARPFRPELIGEMNLDKSYAFYKDRFADAGDFTFIFLGNLDLQAMRPLVERYLGALPSLHRKESWRDEGIRPPRGVVAREVHKGLEPKSRVGLVFTGPFQFDQAHRNAIRALALILETRLREILREDLSGTYGASVDAGYTKIPDQEYSVRISFGCDPARVEELVNAVFSEIDNVRNTGPTEQDVSDSRQALFRDYETNMKENGWLLAQITSRYRLGEDPRGLLHYKESLEGLSREVIQQAARTYLDRNNYVKVTLFPESKEKPEKEQAKASVLVPERIAGLGVPQEEQAFVDNQSKID
jgi:zinc protease